MANRDLILGARRIGQARGFVDYGKILGENIKSPALKQVIEESKARYFQNIKEKEAKLAGFINQKAYMDTSKINEYNVDMATEFLTGKRAEYLNAANIAAAATVGSEDYVNAVSVMNSVNNSIKNFDAELQAWRQLDAEQTLDFDKTKISRGNFNYGDVIETMQDPRSENGPSFKVDADGRVTMIIKDAEGKVIKELKRQEYFLRADEKMTQLSKLGLGFKNLGSNNQIYDEKLATEQMQQWLNDDHTKLLSLARDSFLGVPAMIKDEDLENIVYDGLTGRELLQKDNQAQLKNFLAEKYGGILKERYDAGLADYVRLNPGDEEENNPNQVKALTSSMRNSSLVIDTTTTPVGYNSYEEFFADPKFKNDKERNAYLISQLKETGSGVTPVSAFNVEESNKNYANKLSVLLNGPRYGSKDIKYFTKEQLIAMVLQNEDKYEERGITKYATRPDIRGAEDFVNRTYGDSYLYSRDISFGEANVQGIPINVFEDDPFIEALLTGSGAVDDGL